MRSYKLKITPEAFQEIQKAIDYYNIIQKGLGKRFYLDLQAQFTLIKKNPFSRSIRYDDVRFAVLNRFPYAAHFVINEQTRSIIVQAVLSHHRDPEVHWKKRD